MREQTDGLDSGLCFCLLGLFNEVEKRLDPCLCGRSEKTLDFVRGEVLIQELNDVRFEFPARYDSSAREVLVHRPAVAEWNFTPELDTVNHHVIMNFIHLLFPPLGHIPIKKLRIRERKQNPEKMGRSTRGWVVWRNARAEPYRVKR